uniref:Calnexin n=1 Tax=Arcella intermedia TaxID=1963864 RepID=A0A6B2L2U2_9EUKA
MIVDTLARKHAIIAQFDQEINNEGKDLLIQYELRLQKDLDCGGAYIKLLTSSTLPPRLADFSNEVPYTIMFGPDKCGATNKVHFILRHLNPVSKAYEEKHLTNPPPIQVDTLTHLYSLIIRKDNSFSILVDNSEVRSGSLLEDMTPPVNPPKEIDDPMDKKPKDWVDEDKIPDPVAVKPDDWDETLPATIVDPDDEKPEGWLDNEPLSIPDPNVPKPADWDDELDGDWEAPSVPNPKCEEVGCGEWKPRHIPNPEYKGKWRAPLIDNPKYIGEWHPRKIPNPHYFVDENPQKLEKMNAIGIEIWTMKDGILFDNILITHSEVERDRFTEETWEKKHTFETAIRDAELAKTNPTFTSQVMDILKMAQEFAADPENFTLLLSTFAVVVLVPLILCFCSLRGSKPKAPKPNQQDKQEEEKDEDQPSPAKSPEDQQKAKKKKKKAE